MSKVVSKIRAVQHDEDKVYAFLSDFRNLDELVPADKIRNWESSEDKCRFDIPGFGSLGMQVVEKEPYKLVKLANTGSASFSFTLWIQIKQVNPADSRVRLTARAEMNAMMKAMVQKHLQKGLDAMVDKLAEYLNSRSDI